MHFPISTLGNSEGELFGHEIKFGILKWDYPRFSVSTKSAADFYRGETRTSRNAERCRVKMEVRV